MGTTAAGSSRRSGLREDKVRRSHICAGTLAGAATEESRMLSGTGLSGNGMWRPSVGALICSRTDAKWDRAKRDRAKRDRAKWEWYVRRCLGVYALFACILSFFAPFWPPFLSLRLFFLPLPLAAVAPISLSLPCVLLTLKC